MPTRGYTDPGSRRTSWYDPTIQTTYATDALWKDCPLLESIFDPTVGYYYFNDFIVLDKGTEDIILTQATTGTGVAGSGAGGIFTLDAGAVTDGQGPQIQLAGIDFLPAAGKDIWFEIKLRDSFITGDLFVGLAEIDTTITATSDTTTANHIGLSSYTGDGILLRDCNKASTRVNTGAISTLVASTYTRLGFKVSGVTSVQFYVDGVAAGSTVATASIPVVGLTPSVSIHATGTNRDVVDIDWIRCFQLR